MVRPATEWMFSLRVMCVRCEMTVCMEIHSTSAISLLLRPRCNRCFHQCDISRLLGSSLFCMRVFIPASLRLFARHFMPLNVLTFGGIFAAINSVYAPRIYARQSPFVNPIIFRFMSITPHCMRHVVSFFAV